MQLHSRKHLKETEKWNEQLNLLQVSCLEKLLMINEPGLTSAHPIPQATIPD